MQLVSRVTMSLFQRILLDFSCLEMIHIDMYAICLPLVRAIIIHHIIVRWTFTKHARRLHVDALQRQSVCESSLFYV